MNPVLAGAAALVIVLWLLSWDARRKLERARASGLYPPEGAGTDLDVMRLIRASETTLAIRLYRALHHTELKDAREAVLRLRAQMRSRGEI